MIQTKENTTGKETKKEVSDVKKSKIALYWERKPNEGTIMNMRAVLR